MQKNPFKDMGRCAYTILTVQPNLSVMIFTALYFSHRPTCQKSLAYMKQIHIQ